MDSTLITWRWILIFLSFTGIAFDVYRKAKKSRLKENLSNWNEITKSKTAKENILFAITLFSAFIILITPCFTVMKFSFFQEYSFSGFSFIFDHSEDFFNVFDEFSLPFFIASLSLAIFVSGVGGLALTTISYLNCEKGVTSNRFPISACLMTGGNMIVSLVIANMIEEENYSLIEIATGTHIPFILECIILIVFLIIKYGITDEMLVTKTSSNTLCRNTHAAPPTTFTNAEATPKLHSYANSHDIVHELKLYKELLDCGIITQEEFDHQKSALLKLISR